MYKFRICICFGLVFNLKFLSLGNGVDFELKAMQNVSKKKLIEVVVYLSEVASFFKADEVNISKLDSLRPRVTTLNFYSNIYIKSRENAFSINDESVSLVTRIINDEIIWFENFGLLK